MQLTTDTVVVAIIVATAAAFIVRRVVRAIQSSRASKAGCTSCGCGESKDPMSV